MKYKLINQNTNEEGGLIKKWKLQTKLNKKTILMVSH